MAVTAENKKASARAKYTVEKLLGIKSVNVVKLTEKIEAGFSFDALERLGKTTGLSLEMLRVAMRIKSRTLTRRRQERKLSPEESDRLVSVSRLLAQTFELFEGDREAGMRWFTSPNRALGEHSALEIAATETGTREVENLIGRLEHGVFT